MAEKIKLTEDDACDIAFDCHTDYYKVHEQRHEARRWLQGVTTIVVRVADGKLFNLTWDRALTESQEHDFYGCELVEVERKVETKTIEVVTYEEVQA